MLEEYALVLARIDKTLANFTNEDRAELFKVFSEYYTASREISREALLNETGISEEKADKILEFFKKQKRKFDHH